MRKMSKGSRSIAEATDRLCYHLVFSSDKLDAIDDFVRNKIQHDDNECQGLENAIENMTASAEQKAGLAYTMCIHAGISVKEMTDAYGVVAEIDGQERRLVYGSKRAAEGDHIMALAGPDQNEIGQVNGAYQSDKPLLIKHVALALTLVMAGYAMGVVYQERVKPYLIGISGVERQDRPRN